uniref:Uncharacterized protein n=1 Tax=Vitis vinifera TaxID=29760 RepID=A5BLF5_VITVI|nr:hypothetical protein VITISV_040898 [Vitis vinifera]
MDAKGRFNFRRGGSISQRRGIFAGKGHFRNPFRSCEMRPFHSYEIGVGGCEMALVCQEVVSQLRKFSQRGAWGCEMIFAAKCRFRNGLFGVVKSFRSKVAISQQTCNA